MLHVSCKQAEGDVLIGLIIFLGFINHLKVYSSRSWSIVRYCSNATSQIHACAIIMCVPLLVHTCTTNRTREG